MGSVAALIHVSSQAQEHTEVLKEAAWSVMQQNIATHSGCASHGDVFQYFNIPRYKDLTRYSIFCLLPRTMVATRTACEEQLDICSAFCNRFWYKFLKL